MNLLHRSSKARYLLLNVYLPYKCDVNLDEYIACMGTIQQIIEEAHTSNIMICGDFNCDPRIKDEYGKHLADFCEDTSLSMADLTLLNDNTFTYISDAWGTTSWIDHCVCSAEMMNIISNIEVNYGFVLSDHRPLSVVIECSKSPATEQVSHEAVFVCSARWNDTGFCNEFKRNTAMLLEDVKIPDAVKCNNAMCEHESHLHDINSLYSDIIEIDKDPDNTCRYRFQ